MAGYSGTPLVKKLGIKSGFRLIFINAPSDYATTLGNLPPAIVTASSLDLPLDFIQFFAEDAAGLTEGFPKLMKALKPAGMLWISWPKKTAKVSTDLTEDVVRQIGLAAGMVDVKVCAVDEKWSGLKFVYRRKDRPAES